MQTLLLSVELFLILKMETRLIFLYYLIFFSIYYIQIYTNFFTKTYGSNILLKVTRNAEQLDIFCIFL